jgi:hypothetical protein
MPGSGVAAEHRVGLATVRTISHIRARCIPEGEVPKFVSVLRMTKKFGAFAPPLHLFDA